MQLNIFKLFSVFLIALLFSDASVATTPSAKNSITKVNYDTMKKHLDQKKRYKIIKYYNSCDGGPGECITNFHDTNVQMTQAVAIAQEYARVHDNKEIKCSSNWRISLNDDYIKCTSLDNEKHYEFMFDDLKESVDATIQKHTARALCSIYRGFFSTKCSLLSKNADQFKSSLGKFGYSATCTPDKLNPNHTKCNIIYNSKSATNYTPRTAFGIDPRKFINLQIQSGGDLEFLLKRYSARQVNQTGQKLTSFRCNKSFTTYKNDSLTNPKDDILTCTVNGHPIDFLFDDMNEAFDFEARAGQSGLQCIADSGGTYDGQNCHGLTRQQCNTLNQQVPGGTTWDTMLETCVLNDAAAANKINKITSAAASIGVSTVLVIATVATGGATIFVVAGVVGTAGAAASQAVQNHKEDKTRDFLAHSTKCTTPQCAESTLKTFTGEVAQYYDDIDSQLLTAVDEEIARLLNLIPEDSAFYTKLIQQSISDSQDISNFANWSTTEKLGFATNALVAIGAVAGLTSVAKSGWASITNRVLRTSPSATLGTLTGAKMTNLINLRSLSNTGSLIDGSNSLHGLSQ